MAPNKKQNTPDTGNTTDAIYLLCHGEIEPENLTGNYIGRTDFPLSENGYRAARQWTRRLNDIHFEKIYSSDLLRSVETARIIAAHRAIPIERVTALREIDHGAWEGRSLKSVRRLQPEKYRHWRRDVTGYRPPGGENFQDLSRRVLPFFEEVINRMEKDILIVSHINVNRVILCHLLGIPLCNMFQFNQDYGAINIVIPGRGQSLVTAFNHGL